MLDQQDGGVEVLVDATQQPHQLVPCHGIELRCRLVQHDQRGLPGEGSGERDALQLAPGELGGGPVEQMRDAQRERRLLHRPRHSGPPAPLILEREAEFGADGAHHDLRLRVLEEGPHDRGQLAGTVLAGVHPGDQHAAGELSSVEVRDEPAGGSEQR